MRRSINSRKSRDNQPRKTGTTLWCVMLIRTPGGRFVRVNRSGERAPGEQVQAEQRIRSITPQAAARRFIKKRLPVVAVLQDDHEGGGGAKDLADALGGAKAAPQFVKVGDANRHRRGRFRNMKTELGADTGGTYGIKVVYS